MSMSDMDMGMMGMDMGTSLFQDENMRLARTYWYLICGVLGLLLLIRGVNSLQRRQRLRTCASQSVQFPTKPRSRPAQAWATATAIVREMSYPQLYVPSRLLAWMTPPPAGRVLVLLAYWAVVVYMATAGAVVKDAYFWERIGFRNAWVTVTQVPLLYLLAAKKGGALVAALAGTSYERLNWLHRWVARTLLVTASVHGWYFWTEWSRAGILATMQDMMPMVRYGLAAWALLLWAVVSGLAPLRHLSYELFVAQHVATAVALLYVVHAHVPAYAQYNVWLAVAALCFDRFSRGALLVWQNVNLSLPLPRLATLRRGGRGAASSSSLSRCRGIRRIGHRAHVRAVGDDVTVVTVKDVHFPWRAGQHLYLWMPAVGLADHHPYTIACAHPLPGACVCNSVQLVVRRHGGFSRRLHDAAVRAREQRQQSGDRAGAGGGEDKETFTAFVTGPYGAPPAWDAYETLVLVSASTGASFTLPILESVLMPDSGGGGGGAGCVRRVAFLLAARRGDEIGYYVSRLREMVGRAGEAGVELLVHVAVTRGPPIPMLVGGGGEGAEVFSEEGEKEKDREGEAASSSSWAPGGTSAAKTKAGVSSTVAVADVEKTAGLRSSSSSTSSSSKASSGDSARAGVVVRQSGSRPDVEAFIRRAVEATGGETSVVVCGGKSLAARARNCVARLSDERAVHKGTGAQGIHLHVEEYCF